MCRAQQYPAGKELTPSAVDPVGLRRHKPHHSDNTHKEDHNILIDPAQWTQWGLNSHKANTNDLTCRRSFGWPIDRRSFGWHMLLPLPARASQACKQPMHADKQPCPGMPLSQPVSCLFAYADCTAGQSDAAVIFVANHAVFAQAE